MRSARSIAGKALNLTLVWILGSAVLGSVIAVLAAAAVLTASSSLIERLLPRLISFSTGALLGAALLGMLPHALKTLPPPAVGPMLLIGLLSFFVLERLLVWRHCHQHDCTFHASTGSLLLIGDAFHNFVDGVVLAGAFLHSTPLGLSVAISTVAHEVPQELGEFMVYLRSGYTRRRALVLNLATSLTTVLGAVLGYCFLSRARTFSSNLLVFAAAGFLYVALADLIPSQRGKTSLKIALGDLLLVFVGIGVMAFFARHH